MSSGFSAADRFHLAVNSCLPCLARVTSNDSLTNPSSSSQLRGLLIDPDSDTLSLHSNPGRIRRASRKHKNSTSTRSSKRHITLFGYNLFGRPAPPPIQLPDDDHDPLYSATGPLESALTTQSTATFDSDAALLDVHTIDGLSGPTASALLAEAEEEEQRQREERRKKRKEKKEIKKLARALAVSGEGGFEGFQGSGDGYPGIPSPFLPVDEEHGPDQNSQQPPSPTSLLPHIAMVQEGDDEEADLDGVVYTRRRNTPLNGGSDSRSRTSTSISDRYSAVGSPYPRQPPMTTVPTVTKSSSSTSSKKGKAKSKSTSSHASSSASYTRTKSMSSSNSNSNYTNTDNTSFLVTPTSPNQSCFPHKDEDYSSHNTSVATIISPSTIEQGQGFFDLEEDELPQAQVRVMPRSSIKSHHQTMDAAAVAAPGFVVGAESGSTFPSTGLGRSGPRSTAGKMRGAFLADTSV